jgi:deoxyribonuclease-4
MLLEIGGHYDEVHSLDQFLKKLAYNINSKGNVMQIFLGDKLLSTLSKKYKPSNSDISIIKNTLKKSNTKLFIHANLRVNLSAPLTPRYKWNQDNVLYDLILGKKLGAIGVIVHLGTRTLQGELMSEKDAYDNMTESINYLISNAPLGIKLILEVNAGQENKIGRTIPELARIYHSLKPIIQKRVGFCWDTAHLFTSGIHMDTVNGVKDYLDEFKREIGYKKILVTHLNDSDADFESGIDRHENLGKGYIYKNNNWEPLEIMAELLRKEDVPLILETRDPKKYAYEIKLVRELAKKGKSKLNRQNAGAKKKGDVVEIFRKMEFIHLLLGNMHEARAYKNSTRIIQNYLLKYDLPVLRLSNINSLKDMEGVGKGTIEKIEEIETTGNLKRLGELLKAVKYSEKEIDTMLELEGVLGVGPKIAKKMVDAGIKGVSDLKKKGKWKLTEMQKIGVKYYKDLQMKIPRVETEKWQARIIKALKTAGMQGVEGIMAGSYRMGKKQSGDLDFMLIVPGIETVRDLNEKGSKVMVEVIEILLKNGILKDYLTLGTTEIMAMVYDGSIGKYIRQMDLKIVPKTLVPLFLLYFASGEQFSRKIRAEAKKQGYTLNQWGLTKAGKLIPIKDEKEVFEILGLPYLNSTQRI